MKLQLPKIKKHFKKDGSSIKPDLYWKIILNSSFVLIALFCVFGFYNFSRINKDSVPSDAEANLGNPSVQSDKIDSVLKYFEDRRIISGEVLVRPVPIVDPSL